MNEKRAEALFFSRTNAAKQGVKGSPLAQCGYGDSPQLALSCRVWNSGGTVA